MIIGFTGKKRSGKTTAAKMLAEKFDAIRINFKDSLVDEVKEGFPDLLELFKEAYSAESIDDLFEDKPDAVRRLLQNYGTDVRRKMDGENYWVFKWLEKVRTRCSGLVIVDDVRFLNEAQAITDLGGIIIKINRGYFGDTDTHISETEMDEIPVRAIIPNNGSEEDLLRNIIDFINKDVQEIS